VAKQTNIDKTEWEDFDTALRLCKRSRDEFEWSEYVSPMVRSGIQPLLGSVTIRHVSTGTERVYTTGFGSTWVADFQHDIERGVF
jgi:hypothetical protein